MFRRFVITFAAAGAVAAALLPPAAAKTEKWTDLEGNRFRGEPAEIIGPCALFRTSPRSGRRVPLHLLSPEDCVRFHEAVQTRPARAADWSQATTGLPQELLGGVERVKDGRIVPADLKGRPEPEFLILFFANPSVGRSWDMVGGDTPAQYWDLQKKHPGLVEAVFWAPRSTAVEQNKMAVTMNMGWLVFDQRASGQMRTMQDLNPDDDYAMIVVNRDGVPVFSSRAENPAAIKQVFTELNELIDLMQPDEPLAWKDRVHYLSAVQQALHRADKAAPVLVGDPLNNEALKKAGVAHFHAKITVTADAKVRRVFFVNGEKDLKPEMAQAIGKALLQAAFVPAVENGRFVDGVYEYAFTAPP